MKRIAFFFLPLLGLACEIDVFVADSECDERRCDDDASEGEGETGEGEGETGEGEGETGEGEGETGEGEGEGEEPPRFNDRCEDAQVIDVPADGSEVTVVGSTLNATPDWVTNDASLCQGELFDAQRDVFYLLRAPGLLGGRIVVSAESPGFAHVLYQLPIGCDSEFTVNCVSDGGELSIEPDVFGEYWIVLDGYSEEHFGPFTFSVRWEAPPANDQCEAPEAIAVPISGGVAGYTGTNFAAGDDVEHPSNSCPTVSGGADVFFTLRTVEGQNGVVDFVVLTDNYDAAAYTASAGCDAVQVDPCAGEGARVRTRVQENAEYTIVIDGLGAGDEGDFELYLQFSYEVPGGETCATAPSLNDIARRGRIVGDKTNSVHHTDPRDYDDCTGQPAGGGDLVFAVTLQPGETITADYAYPAFVDNQEFRGFILDRGPSFYVLDGCAETGAIDVSCVDGSDNPDITFEERIVVRNDGALSHTYYLVLDETSSNVNGAEFDLAWLIE